MLQFAVTVDKLDRPEDVLDALHDVSSKRLQINVLGAAIFPLRAGQYDAFEAGTTAFLHWTSPEKVEGFSDRFSESGEHSWAS